MPIIKSDVAVPGVVRNRWHSDLPLASRTSLKLVKSVKREETQVINAQWHAAMRPGKRSALDKSSPWAPPWTGWCRPRHASGEGETPIPRHQAAVRLRQGQAPWAGQEQGLSGDAVCAEQSVDGTAPSLAEAAGMGTSAPRQRASGKGELPLFAPPTTPVSSSSGIPRLNGGRRTGLEKFPDFDAVAESPDTRGDCRISWQCSGQKSFLASGTCLRRRPLHH